MTPGNGSIAPAAPVVVPRWEWRTFGELEDVAAAFASLRTAAASSSEETYLLSRSRDASVKIRAGLLDLKVLRRIAASGLQLWIPTVKASFPVDEGPVAMAFEALGLTTPRRPRYTFDELVEEVQGPGSRDVRAVTVHKTRRRSVLDGCMVEFTELAADGVATHTVAVESPDSDLVSATVRRLGLAGRPNTCVAKGLRALLHWEPTRFAVFDVGTNSLKLIVGDRRGGGAPRVELDTAVVTRLGEGLAETGELSAEAMRRTSDTIARLVEQVRREEPTEIVAVGTAGLRQASNRDEFLDLVVARCGVGVEVISGPEEARLAYRAAVSSLQPTGERLLVFDSGGGSSQFTFGSRDAIEEQFSLDVGAVHFTDRFGLRDAVGRDTVAATLTAVEADLVRLAGRPRPDTVVAIGGTSTNLAAVSRRLAAYDADVVHGTVVDLAEVDRQIELYRSRSAQERREILGLQPARAEVILAGACIVRTILTVSGQERLTVSDRGLRHGVVAERFPPTSGPAV